MINEFFQKKVDFTIAPESDESNTYYVFTINGNNYKAVYSKINKKGAYVLTLGSLTPNGTQKLFKIAKSDLNIMIATALSCHKDFVENQKPNASAIIMKFPKAFSEARVRLVSKIIKKLKLQKFVEYKIDKKDSDDAEYSYLFYGNKSKPKDTVFLALKSKTFANYDVVAALKADGLSMALFDTIKPAKKQKSKVSLFDTLSIQGQGLDIIDVENELNKELDQIKIAALTSNLAHDVENEEELMDKIKSKKAIQKNKEKDNDVQWFWNLSKVSDRMFFLNKIINDYLNNSNVVHELLLDYIVNYREADRTPKYYDRLDYLKELISDTYANYEPENDTDDDLYLFLAKALFSNIQYLPFMEYYFDMKLKNKYSMKMIFRYYLLSYLDNMKAANENDLLEDFIENRGKVMKFFNRIVRNGGNSSSGIINVHNHSIYVYPAFIDVAETNKLMNEIKSMSREDMADFIHADHGVFGIDVYKNIQKKAQDVEFKSANIVLAEVDLGVVMPLPSENDIFNSTSVQENVTKYKNIQGETFDNDESKISTIQAYTGSAYKTINGGYRNINSASEETLKKMLKMIEQMEMYSVLTTEPLQVSRKTDFPDTISLDKLYVENAALSTSFSASVWGGKHKLVIHLPTGSRVFFATDFSYHSSEKEVILPPGAILKPFRKFKKESSSQVYHEMLYMGTVTSHIKDKIKAKLGYVVQTDETYKLTSFKGYYIMEEREKDELSKEELIQGDEKFLNDDDGYVQDILDGNIDIDWIAKINNGEKA